MPNRTPPILLCSAMLAILALLWAAEFAVHRREQTLARGYYTRGRTSQFYARGTPQAPPAAPRSR